MGDSGGGTVRNFTHWLHIPLPGPQLVFGLNHPVFWVPNYQRRVSSIKNGSQLKFLRLFVPFEQIPVLNFKQRVFLRLEALVPLTKSKWFAGRTARKFSHWAPWTRNMQHTISLSCGRQKRFDICAGNKRRRTGYLQKNNLIALRHTDARLEEEDPATHWHYSLWARSGESPSHWPNITCLISV